MDKERGTFIPDSRFGKIGNEALLTGVLLVLQIVVFMIIAYVFGAGDPIQYTYLFGFPLWFSLCFIAELVFIAIFAWLLLKKFSDVSLSADDPNYDYERDEVRK